jgi:hypothetical protein
MKNVKMLIALVTISGTCYANFSPELIQLRNDIEALDRTITKQVLERADQQDALMKSSNKEGERLDQEIAKKMVQMQKYWPDIKKELDGPCNGVLGAACEEQEGINAALCKQCADLMTLMFDSLRWAPNNQLLLELKPYATKYIMPQISKFIQTESHMSKEAADIEAQKNFDATFYNQFASVPK